MSDTLNTDIAIVGGGITGLYICYKLKQSIDFKYSISLFEGTNRFGGRIETVKMGGFLAEYGPMRFEKMAQPLLMNLISELGLKTKHFAPYTAANDSDALFDLTFDESGGKYHGSKLTTLELLKLGILRLLNASKGDMNDPNDPLHLEWWANLDEDYYSFVRNKAAFHGKYLYQMGFWNALSLVLSFRAVNKIIHYGTFYHVIHFNPNAAEWVIFWLRGLHPNDELVGIEQGTESLIHELVNRLSSSSEPSVSLHLNHRLTAFFPQSDGRILLEFHNAKKNVKIQAKHVVLAIPRCPLMQLRPMLPDYIGDHIDSVIPIPLVKCFFVNERPWWDETTPPQIRASSTPAREIHYAFKTDVNSRHGLVMVYGDPPSMHYWTPFVQHKEHNEAELNLDQRLVEGYLQFLRSDLNNSDVKEMENEAKSISCFGIRDWSREPFEAGCHIWKAGIHAEEAIKELTAFSLTGANSSFKNVHICGEAYSDFQGFIEGGLRTALQVIKTITKDSTNV